MANIPTNIAGGFSYTPVSYSWGSTGQAINGGFSFDLPLASVAAFTNTALDFNANNTNANRGFLSGVISQSQSNLSGVTGQALDLQKQTLGAVSNMFSQAMSTQRYVAKKAFEGGGCFITTAVTKAKGLSDKCAELQALRKFRDEHMLSTVEGKAIVSHYYQVAPKIVEVIDKRPDAASVYARLDSLFIQPALHRIGSGEFEVAEGIYKALVIEAGKIAGVDLNAIAVPVVCNCNGGSRAANFHKKTCPVRGA